jgi:carbon monoxide dehydrogenase subunit G
MELNNEFRVPVPIEEAWAVLTDVERIAPCMPGCQLQEIDGDEFRGTIKVKVGPITAQYKGKARFLEQDTATWRAVLKAEGRDSRGQGSANATVTAVLTPDDPGTLVRVTTDLTITGKVAQFGRGVLADVSGKLIDQFVISLEQDVLRGDQTMASTTASPDDPAVGDTASGEATVGDTASGEASATSPGFSDAASPAVMPVASPVRPVAINSTADAPGIRRINATPAEPVDLLGTAGVPMVKRIAPMIVVAITLLLLGRRRWRSGRARS